MTLSELLTSADSGRLRLYSCCGGQGPSNLTGLDDLVHLVRTYGDRDPIRHLIDTSSSHLELLASIPHRSPFFSGRGFPLRRWLDDFAAIAPPSDELTLSPFSFPINTLLSLAHYALTAHTIGVDPGQLRDRLHGVIGHSQGVFAATAIAHSGKGWPAFYNAASLALKISFWVGLESHLAAPGSTLSAEDVADCLQHDEGAPSYLLSVTGLSHDHLQRLIRKANTEGVQLSLINNYNKFVLAGTPQALREICLAIRTVNAPQSLDQTRVPFTQRRPIVDVRFLPVSAPYHSSLLASVEPYVVDAIKDLCLNGGDIAIPLYCQVNGKTQSLQAFKGNVLSALIRAVTVERVDWPDACRKIDSATHVLSFGPGSVGNLVQDVLEGTGVHVMNLSGGSLSSYLDSLNSVSSLPVGQNWGHKYSPRLGTLSSKEAEPYIETKMTRLLGLPHVMVAGMTPTTCSPEFVAAVMNAGYHVEFACGGYHHPETLEAALRQLAAAIPLHRSITCNVIYASPKSLTWQINLLHDLIKEGLPIDGLTVGAGIPSPDVVREWVEQLDLSHIWFKPGSVDAIDRVLAIARQHPGLPIGLQWTGGRAGGHHSFEDFHQAILDRYSHIRNCENVILVAGSGFGGGHDTWPYLTGSWSQKLGFAAMPFDGVLLGSRMMVAHEAKTSLAAKQLIVQAPGVGEDEDWTRSQHEAIGDVISVVSEMGQPIHVLATRGMRLWHELDRRFFSIRDPKQLRAALKQHREEIISRLNKDYARPWFAIADDGRPVEMEDLTYKQVLHRLCELMFVERHSRWIDPSYLGLVHDFVRLLHTRFGTGMSLSNSPAELKVAFDEAYGTHADEVLYPDDVALLLSLFHRQGLKPVPFIPILDESFETWFKKDSLWQSEGVDSVLDQDAQRVCIIQGPVAVQHSKVCDEPAKEILNGICGSQIGFLKNQTLASREDDMISAIVQDADVLPGIHVSHDGSICRYQLMGPAIPSSGAILDRLTAGCSWGRAALISKNVLFGRHRVKNPIHDAFQPCIGDIIEIKYASGTPQEITLYHTAVQNSGSNEIRGALEITHLDADTISVALITHSVQTVAGNRPALEFRMKLLGVRMGQPVIQIDKETYLDRVRDLYTELWMGPAPCPISAGLNSEFSDGSAVMMPESVQEFLAVISQSGPARSQAWSAQGRVVPLDYAVVLAWTALTKPVLLPALDGDPLQLLHQSISLRLARGVRPLSVGDVVQTASRITEHTITATGQRVEVSAEILRDAQPVVYLRTTFIIQRRTHSASQQFRSVHEQDMVVHVSSPVQLQLLISRKWLFLDVASHEILGKRLLFRLNTQTVSSAKGTPSSLQVSGLATLLSEQSSTTTTTGAKVGRVYLEEEDHSFNPVMDFLSRHGSPLVQRQPLQSPGWTGDAVIPFTAPPQSSAYARVSKDTNPIHTCPLFARFAGRGQPVLHGMHLSATVRRILEWMVGDTERRRFQGWKVSFDGIVRAYDQLRMEVQHRAMEDGLMVVHVKVLNVNTGDQIMHAEAMIEQAPTAYLFTGQGTQEQGMGMGLYGTHKAAQAVWDRAERHFESQYGISLLHLVRDNPKSLVVNFRGKRGQQIRANYLAMRSSSESDKLMLPGLTETSRSYTFSYPAGLLKSTQFAQPALVVMELAEYAHLQAQGVVQRSALFAGHSLGEYSALGACSTFMQSEPLLSLIFYRGLKMQNALPRDGNGRTEYAMMAVDPSRIGTDFDECRLMELVQLIARETGLLLEVVNHNVQSRQYVCAGHIRSLWVMGQVCDNLSLATSNTSDTMDECIRQNIANSQKVTSHENLARGIATIPLSGVDIPFHSQMLRGHIDDYRQYLRRHLRVADIKADELVGRWVPNVVGKPFTLEISYIRLVQQVTQSRALQGLLEQVGERL